LTDGSLFFTLEPKILMVAGRRAEIAARQNGDPNNIGDRAVAVLLAGKIKLGRSISRP
jgi:hypothetical protein